jgi:hypothetical protein
VYDADPAGARRRAGLAMEARMSTQIPGQPLSRLIVHFFVVFLAALCMVLAACGGDSRKQKIPVPALSSVSPTSVMAGAAAFTLTVNGLYFVAGSTVNWNGTARATTLVSGSRLTAAIQAADVASAGTVQVTVVNPAPGGGTSSSISFTIESAAPVAAALSPANIIAGSAAFDLTVNGSGFVSGSAVHWNGSARPTTFVSSSVLKAAIAVTDVAGAGTAQVRVVNPLPGNGTSAALTFTVQNAAPVIASLAPSSVRVGSVGFDLAVTGTGFVQGATVQWGGANRVTTYLNATQLIAAITATDVSIEGTVNVVVRNPEPTIGPSNALQFVTISGPSPPPGGFPVRITVAPDGSPPNGPSVNGGMDWDGEHVVFASEASNLVTGDSNGAYDLFLRETCNAAPTPCTPTTRRILMAADGSQPNGDSGSTATHPGDSLSVSFDGRHVAFVSSASNLVVGDTNGVDDVFVKETCIDGGTACASMTVRASTRVDGSQSTLPASRPSISDGGRYVFFVSADPNMVAGDSNGVADVFMRDTCLGGGTSCTPSTIRVSVAANGGDANGASGEPSFTGRYVAFSSAASNLVAGDPNSVPDIFIRDLCLSAEPGCVPSTRLVTVGQGGEPANGASWDPQMGPPLKDFYGHEQHGRFIVFVSNATNLVAGDTNSAADVFERDTCSGEPGCVPSMVRVSVAGSGEQIAGASTSPDFVRWDGEVVPFVTAANGVVSEDTNSLADVYVRRVCPVGAGDYCRTSTRRVSVGVGGVQGDGASYAPRLNHDPWGVWVVTFMSDATNLIPGVVTTANYGCIFMNRIP